VLRRVPWTWIRRGSFEVGFVACEALEMEEEEEGKDDADDEDGGGAVYLIG